MITAFLPCRLGSERVPKKNTKDFAGVKGGLLKIKLTQLLNTKNIDKIVVSTNDFEVIEIVQGISNSIIIDNRPEHLASSRTSTDDLISYVPSVIENGHILWTHVTSPFVNSNIYDKAIIKYLSYIKSNEFDSLMTVDKIQTFLWNDKGPVNYKKNKEKWPRTQTLPKYFEINSGIFLNSRKNYLTFNDRIGDNPYLMESEGYESFDIDWPRDFELAEYIYKNSL